MDPLSSLFVDVFDSILQHLNAKEVLKCSLVSRSWYEIIGSSRKCMKKIVLKIDCPSHQINDLKLSLRKYENIKILPGSRNELAEVIQMFRPKDVSITDDHEDVIDHRDYLIFMQSMAKTVEQLQPGEVRSVNAKSIETVNFPKLQELQYTLTNRSAFSIFLGSNPKLEKVLLSFNDEVPTDFLVPNNIVYTFLQQNSQIKSLWMCEIDFTFLTDVTQGVDLDLKTFAFAKSRSDQSEIIGDNLVKFIKSQRKLEWLKILSLREGNIFARIWNECVFQKLFIMDCSLKGSLSEHVLMKNSSIIEINFYLNSSCHILKFLQATPNLKSFKLRQLSKQILLFAVQNLRSLERIQYQSVEKGVDQFYNELKVSPAANINQQIQLEEMNFFEFVGRDAGF